jgi:transcriptional regulator with XRE-family HTH domain
MKIGKRVAALRRQREMLRVRLAEAVGVTINAIAAVEKEYCNPTLENTCKIADALGCSVDYLLGRVHEVRAGSVSGGPVIERLHAALDALSIPDLETLAVVAEQLRRRNAMRSQPRVRAVDKQHDVVGDYDDLGVSGDEGPHSTDLTGGSDEQLTGLEDVDHLAKSP